MASDSTAERLSTGLALRDMYPRLDALKEARSYVAAIADDHWLASVHAWLLIPDLIAGEDEHWAKLVAAVPDVTRFDLRLPANPSDADRYRQLARRAAIRALAVACNVAKQNFEAHPLLAGDTSLKLPALPGVVCRIGEPLTFIPAPTPSMVSKLKVILDDLHTIENVEVAHLPLLTAGPAYERQFSRWRMLQPLREWEENHRFPLVGRRGLISECPGCYVQRYEFSLIAERGIPPEVASRICSSHAAAVVHEVRAKIQPEEPDADELLTWAVNSCSAEAV